MHYIIETHKKNFDVRRNQYPIHFPQHIHSGPELIYSISSSILVLLDGKEYRMNPGELFLAFPNQIHGYRYIETGEWFCVIFTVDLFKVLMETFQDLVPANPVLSVSQLPEDIRDQLELIHRLHKEDQDIRAQGLFLALLGQLFPCFVLEPASGDPDTMKTLLSYCFSHYREDISLDSAAQAVHLSKYYISHIFKDRIGVGFNAFINQLRVEYACQLLRNGTGIGDVSALSGFSSPRTFNRVFLKLKGMSPREYRATLQEPPMS